MSTFWLTFVVTAVAVPAYWGDIPRGVLAVIIAAFAVLVYVWRYVDIPATHPIVAGARWVGRPNGATVVRLYQLTRVRVEDVQSDYDSATEHTYLRLEDADGAVYLELSLLEANPALWDLVYHGIRHSLLVGADTNRTTRERLRVNPPPPDPSSP